MVYNGIPYKDSSVYKGGAYKTHTVYKENGGGGGGLPDYLKKLQYIQLNAPTNVYPVISFNSNEITGICSNDKFYFHIDLKEKFITLSMTAFIVRIDSLNFISFGLAPTTTQKRVRVVKKTGYTQYYEIPDGDLVVEYPNETTAKLNNDVYTNLPSFSFNNGYLENLFFKNSGDSTSIDGTKFYELLINDVSDNLRYRIIPVLNLNDNKPYFYETVTGIMKTNSNWIAGPIE